MPSRTTKDCAWLVLAVAGTRYLFRTESPYLLDSINFILGVNEFDPARDQPHPPGYYLYIQAARLLQFVWSDPHTALVALSVIASCGTAVLLYLLALQWFGPQEARFAGLIFLASPLGWFHGGVALVYIVEMFFSLLVGLLCWRNSETRGSAVFASAIALGLAAGVRQSSIAFLAPLWLFSLRKAGAVRIATACGTLAVTLLAWILPMAAESGGASQYWTAFAALWNRAVGHDLMAIGSVQEALLPFVARVLCILAVYVLIFGAVALLPIARPLPARFDASKRVFAMVWIMPGLLFFALVFMRLINGGYLLVLVPPILAVIGAQAAEWYNEAGSGLLGKRAAVCGFTLFNLAAFLFTPTYFSYQFVQTDLRKIGGFDQAMRRGVSPATSLIVSFDDHRFGWRHAGYYLPEFTSIEWPERTSGQDVQIRAMSHGQSEILHALDAGSFQQIVFYPPQANGADLVEVISGGKPLPPGSIQIKKVGDYELVICSADMLYRLFPRGARRAE